MLKAMLKAMKDTNVKEVAKETIEETKHLLRGLEGLMPISSKRHEADMEKIIKIIAETNNIPFEDLWAEFCSTPITEEVEIEVEVISPAPVKRSKLSVMPDIVE